MCIIMSKPAGKKIPQEHISNSHANNRDGVGIMYAEDGVVKIEKWLDTDHDKFLQRLSELDDRNVVVHYRAASFGGVSLENVHPFWVFENKMAMCHNGTIFKAKEFAKDGESDSSAFARILSDLPMDFLGRQGLVLMMREYIGTTSRLAFLDSNGTVAIVNKHLGKEVDGIWYSNDYFERVYLGRGKSVEFSTQRHVSLGYSRDSLFDYTPQPKKELPLRYRDFKKALTSDSDRVYVFTYGTLKRGYGNNRFLGKDARFIGEAVTTAQYPMLDGGFPYLLDMPKKGHCVKGEVWDISVKQLLTSVDGLEGYPNHYVRRVIEVVTTTKHYKAVAYFKKDVTDYDLKREFIREWTGRKSFVSQQPSLYDKDAYLNDVVDYDDFEDCMYCICNACGHEDKADEFMEQGCCPLCQSIDVETF